MPKRAIGLGFNIASVPYKANRWAANLAMQHATDAYQRFTVGGHEQADAIMLQMPAHNAGVGADALSKVPIVDGLLVVQSREVEELKYIDAEPQVLAAAIRNRRKLLHDRRILKATAYGLIGNALRQVIRNDIPAQVEATEYPSEVRTVVLDTAIESNVEPSKLDLSEMDQAIIAIRMARHKDFI